MLISGGVALAPEQESQGGKPSLETFTACRQGTGETVRVLRHIPVSFTLGHHFKVLFSSLETIKLPFSST
jgi:hypothetical protein